MKWPSYISLEPEKETDDPRLEIESQFWMDEYEKIYGKRILIGMGSPLHLVHAVQSAVARHYVEEMKKVLSQHQKRDNA